MRPEGNGSMMTRSILGRRAFLASTAAFFAMPARAQTAWPSRPLRLVIPFPPGGTTDIIGRTLQAPLADRLGQPVVVENRAGGAGTAGVEAMVRAADGHTVALVISSLASNVALQPGLPFDVERDIAPIGLIGFVPNAIAVHPSVPARTLGELVALARARPGALNYGTSGIGTANHFAGELFRLEAGIDIVHTPYRGGGPAINDLVGGQIPVGVNALSSILPQIRAGRVRALATTGKARSAALPDVPTVAESGFPGFDVVEWWGLVAPAAMPAANVSRFAEALNAALARPDIAAKLAEQGLDLASSDPVAFKAFVRAEIAKLAGIVRRAAIKAE